MKSEATMAQEPPMTDISTTTTPTIITVKLGSTLKKLEATIPKPLSQMPAYTTLIGTCNQVKTCSLTGPKRSRTPSIAVTTRMRR